MSKQTPSSTSPSATGPNRPTSAPRKPKSAPSKPATNHAHAQAHHQRQRQPPTRTKRTTLPPNPPRPHRGIPPLPASIPSTPTSNSHPTTSSPISSNVAAATAATRLQHLHATTTLCHALHARNRNQHRAQLWFRHLGLLRRQLTRLLALEVALFELRYGFVGDRGGGGAAEEVRRRFDREEGIQVQRERVERWVRECVVPAAWVGAGTVLREGQFAGVGLVLMGVLADVRGLVGGTDSRVDEGEEGLERSDFQSRDRMARKGDDGTLGNRGGEDVGEVVHRRTAIDQGLRSGTQTPASQHDLMDVDIITREASADVQKARRESSPFAAFGDQDDGPTPALKDTSIDPEPLPATTTMPPTEVTEKKAKVKAREKRKGSDKDRDKKAQSKKKKKDTGNAIDDLFAGF